MGVTGSRLRNIFEQLSHLGFYHTHSERILNVEFPTLPSGFPVLSFDWLVRNLPEEPKMQHILNWGPSLPTQTYFFAPLIVSSIQPHNNCPRLGFLKPSMIPQFFLHLLPQPASGSSWHHLLLSFFALISLWTSPFITWTLALLFGLVCWTCTPYLLLRWSQCPQKEVRANIPNPNRPGHYPLQSQSELFSCQSQYFWAWPWPSVVHSGAHKAHFFLNKH